MGLFAQIGLLAHLIARLAPDFGPELAAAAVSLIALCAVAGRTVLVRQLVDCAPRLAGAANLLMQAVGSQLLGLRHDAMPLAEGCVLFGLGVGNLTSASTDRAA